MSIVVTKEPVGLTIIVPQKHQQEFAELVFRATNLWPDASPAIKEFADVVIHGKPLQDYERLYKPLTTHRS